MSKKRKKLKIVLITLLALTLLGGLAFAGYRYLRPKNNSSLEASEKTKEQTEKNDAERAKSSENKNYNQGDNQGQNTQAGNLSVTITSIGQSGQTVYINAIIDGATSGSCKLSLTKNDKKIEKTATIGLQVSYYICQGFNINSSEFPEKGEWDASIEATSTKGSGRSETKKVNVQ